LLPFAAWKIGPFAARLTMTASLGVCRSPVSRPFTRKPQWRKRIERSQCTKVVIDVEKRSPTRIGNLAPGTAVPQPASTSQCAGATATQGQSGGTSQGSPK